MRVWKIILVAAISAESPAAARSASAPAEQSFSVPFQLIRGHIYVQAFANGKGPYTFVFDTGASGMGRADVRLVAEQSLKKVGQEMNSDGVNVAPIDVVAVESIRLGSIEKRDVELLSRDYNLNKHPDRPVVFGIFGADFFADHLLTIDYPGNRLHFSRGELRKGDPGVFAYDGNFRVPVCFETRCYTGAIDTGSSMTIVVPKDMVGEVRTTTPELAGTGRRANTVSQMYEMALLEPMRIGGVTATDLKIRYSDPSDDEINVGSGFLKDYVLTIDSRNKLLRLERPAPPGEGG